MESLSHRTSGPPWVVTADEPVVTVVVIEWRDAPHLAACLSALAKTESALPFEVVVTLNEPHEAVLACLGTVPSVTVVTSPVNIGFGEANNRAAARARGRYLAFLNHDTEVEPGWLGPLIDVPDGDANVGAVGCALVDGTLQEVGPIIWADGSTRQITEPANAGSAGDWVRAVHYCSAAALLVRRDAFDSVGGFDDAFYPAYDDDTDLCLGLRAAGFEVVVQPRSRVAHRRTASVSLRFAWHLNLQNRRTFAARWADHLATLEHPRTGEQSSAEHLTWLAMGRPQRVLVVGTAYAPPVGLGRWCTVVAPGLQPDEVARRPRFGGARVLAAPLSDHLGRPEVSCDAVVVTGRDGTIGPVVDVVRSRLSDVPVHLSSEEHLPPPRHESPVARRAPGSPDATLPRSAGGGGGLSATDAVPLEISVPGAAPDQVRPEDAAAGRR